MDKVEWIRLSGYSTLWLHPVGTRPTNRQIDESTNRQKTDIFAAGLLMYFIIKEGRDLFPFTNFDCQLPAKQRFEKLFSQHQVFYTTAELEIFIEKESELELKYLEDIQN